MKRLVPLVCSGLLLLGGVVSAQDNDTYASVYSSPEASSELPPILYIAKGLPPVKVVGAEAARRVWESYRTFTPTRKLIPVRSRKTAPAPAAPAAPAVPATRE